MTAELLCPVLMKCLKTENKVQNGILEHRSNEINEGRREKCDIH